VGRLEFRPAAGSDADADGGAGDAAVKPTSVSYRRGDLLDSRLNPRVGDEVSFFLVTDLRTGALSATKVEHPTPPCRKV
jgi:hypothetical protein